MVSCVRDSVIRRLRDCCPSRLMPEESGALEGERLSIVIVKLQCVCLFVFAFYEMTAFDLRRRT